MKDGLEIRGEAPTFVVTFLAMAINPTSVFSQIEMEWRGFRVHGW